MWFNHEKWWLNHGWTNTSPGFFAARSWFITSQRLGFMTNIWNHVINQFESCNGGHVEGTAQCRYATELVIPNPEGSVFYQSSMKAKSWTWASEPAGPYFLVPIIYIYYTNITRTFRKTTQSNIYCCDSNLPNFAWFVCVHCNNYNHACVQSTQLVCMCAATIEKLQGSQTLIEASRSAHSRALKNICLFFSPKWTRKFWSLKGSNDVFKVEVETFTAVGCLHGCMFQDEPRIKL